MTDRLKLFISHGDNGGTGKSMAAAIALDHCQGDRPSAAD